MQTIALVMPNLQKYSERFLSNKINLFQESGFGVIVMVVGAENEKPKVNFPVYCQPILEASGLQRWAFSFWLILKSFIT